MLDECCLTVPGDMGCYGVPIAICCIAVDAIGPVCITPRKTDMSFYSQIANVGCCAPGTKSKCRHTCTKHAGEIKPISLLWTEAAACSIENGDVQSDWHLQSVAYTLLTFDGLALPGDVDDPAIATHPVTEAAATQVWRAKFLSRVLIEGGSPGKRYRLVAVATFADCDGYQMTVEYCVGIAIHEE